MKTRLQQLTETRDTYRKIARDLQNLMHVETLAGTMFGEIPEILTRLDREISVLQINGGK